ncbi:MAG: 2-oxo acid dehydrogenase subunit E2 [Planctomycetia bacterium]|nr:2-oxo acid dehydrogenase subunit E2 [Planctomycetia bacterium]
MAIEFKLPEVSDGVKTVDIAEIKVKAGDVITKGQVVMDLETEKAVVELECPHAGTVAKVLVTVGQTIAIGTPLLSIEAGAAAGVQAASLPTPAAPAAAIPPKLVTSAPTAPLPASPKAASSMTAPAAAQQSAASDDRPPAPAGPATRRLARDLGVDLYQVNGSGPGGRITQEDVQNYVKNILEGRASAPSGGGLIATPPLPDFSQFGPIERQAQNKIAKVSATNLSMAWQTIPHVTQHDLIDITELEEARKRFGDTLGKNGPKVTMTAIVMKALIPALKAFPHVNASLDSAKGELVLKQYYNIGCAVDTPNGLLVPVVKNVDQKSIVQIAADLADLAARAREKKLKPDEMSGATFTITNLGGIGGTGFTPIVNWPEVAILGLSRGRSELKLHGGAVIERLMLPLSLSYDHRVINGADGARFVVKLGQMLGDFFALLTET